MHGHFWENAWKVTWIITQKQAVNGRGYDEVSGVREFASDRETTASLKSSSDGDNLSAVVQMQWHHSKAAIPHEPGYFLGSACLTKLLGQ